MNNVNALQINRHQQFIWGDFLRLNPWIAFLFCNIISLLALYIEQHYVVTDTIYYNSYADQLSMDRIDQIIAVKESWLWVRYLAIPVVLALQILGITLCLNLGALLADVKVGFGRIMGMVTRATLVLALGKVIYSTTLSFSDLQVVDDVFRSDYYSLLGWIGHENIPQWLWYPFWLLNIFQLLFTILLIRSVATLFDTENTAKPAAFALPSYGTGVLVWALLVVFLQLSLNS